MAFHPYLYFPKTCRQAFTRYQEIFGGDLELMSGADLPSDDPVPEDDAHLILHASLTTPDGHLLMGSDDPTGTFRGVQGMMVNYSVTDLKEAQRVFEVLSSEGGQVYAEFGPTFFSPGFGMCRDSFGTPWMVITEIRVQVKDET